MNFKPGYATGQSLTGMSPRQAALSAGEERNEPEEQSKHNTEHETRHDREVKRNAFAFISNIAGKFSESQGRKPGGRHQQESDCDQGDACDDKELPDFPRKPTGHI
jgi:hypothetical protein